ncbi:MAG: phosphoribosylformylglycinamidine synthase subunit PurS [Endomicrobiales bacterium]|nr:phosphoribosylformylglycinamidine synthase subunit PurS [Endomicrobiales bacterium]
MLYVVEIKNKKGFPDKHGEHVKHEARELGVKGIESVSYRPVYSFEGGLADTDIEQIARKILSDPVTEEYLINPEKQKGLIEIEVWLKSGVTDTVAASVAKAVNDIGIQGTPVIKTGQKYFFKGKINQAQAEQIAVKLLYNPMIQKHGVR